MEIVELCKKYRYAGVVAIDLAGDESLCGEANLDHRRAYEVSRPWFWFWWARLSEDQMLRRGPALRPLMG